MKRRLPVLLLAFAFSAAACDDPVSPQALEEYYTVVEANGQSVPLDGIAYYSTDQGACTEDFGGGVISFTRESSNYNLLLSTTLTCTGEADAIHTSHTARGSFERLGDQLYFTAESNSSVFEVATAELVGDRMIIPISRNDGTELTLTLRAGLD